MGTIEMTRVVLDTNVLVSGLLFGGGPGEVLGLCKTGEHRLTMSRAMLDKLLRVLAYPMLQLSEEEIHYLLYAEVLPHVEIVEVSPGPAVVIADRAQEGIPLSLCDRADETASASPTPSAASSCGRRIRRHTIVAGYRITGRRANAHPRTAAEVLGPVIAVRAGGFERGPHTDVAERRIEYVGAMSRAVHPSVHHRLGSAVAACDVFTACAVGIAGCGDPLVELASVEARMAEIILLRHIGGMIPRRRSQGVIPGQRVQIRDLPLQVHQPDDLLFIR
jgi:hypothetical protein